MENRKFLIKFLGVEIEVLPHLKKHVLSSLKILRDFN